MTQTVSDMCPGRAWYALRRTLPPWSFEENLAELVAVLPRYQVDEVIVKVDTEEFNHGQPPLAWIRAYQPLLVRIRDALADIGICFSINPWITLGHADRGRDAIPQLPGLQTMVGHDGTVCTSCACPLSETWRRHAATVWTLYAETQPRVLWFEDDIRTFNHGPVRFGCFCGEHMRRFRERVGQAVERAELVQAMLAPGPPHPWRREFLDLQADVMVDTVRFLAAAVHAVSPETRLGLMSSGPRTHCIEGRRWTEFAAALADGQPVYSRPPLGNYCENSLRGLYESADSIKLTRHCMPPDTREQTELENFPYSRYANSAVFTFLKMAVSFGFGSHGVTLNLFDHGGSAMEQDPSFGRTLGTGKPFLNALATQTERPGLYRGVRLLFHEQAARHRQLPANANYEDLAADGACTAGMLESFGIPTTYGESCVTAATGQTLRPCTDAEVETLLQGGLFLDAAAAVELAERGFSALLGLEAAEPIESIDAIEALGAEEFFHPGFGGAPGSFMTTALAGSASRPRVSRFTLAPQAELIGCFVDPDARRRIPAFYAFENSCGGRVAVSALELKSVYGTPFHNPFRARQLRETVRWLARGRPPVLVHGDGAYPLGLCRDTGDTTLLGFFNLTLDPWPQVIFEFSDRRRPAGLALLESSGEWHDEPLLTAETTGDMVTVTCTRPVRFDSPLFISVRWE